MTPAELKEANELINEVLVLDKILVAAFRATRASLEFFDEKGELARYVLTPAVALSLVVGRRRHYIARLNKLGVYGTPAEPTLSKIEPVSDAILSGRGIGAAQAG